MDDVVTQTTGSRPDVSLLFLSYARSDLLTRAIESVRPALAEKSFSYEIVISDDASPEPHASCVRALGADKLIVSKKNRGLNANCNRGIEACSGNFIVQIEDDWEFTGDKHVFERALRVFDEQADVGVIRLTQPSLGREEADRLVASEESELIIFRNDGESALKNASRRPYSNQPHIKRRKFCKDVGSYNEREEMHWGEIDYQQRVANQSAWKIAAFTDMSVFVHLGQGRSFNPVHKRHMKLQKLSETPIIGPVFVLCRPVLKKIRDHTGLFRHLD